MGAVRTAREVELYSHGVGQAHTLAHNQAVQRVADMLRLDLHIVGAGDDGEHVAIVSDSTVKADGTETRVASIEVFRVVDGRITEVWNCGYQQGVWK